MNTIEKNLKEGGQDTKKKEKHEKNLQKQQVANANYAKACSDLEEFLRNLEARVDVVCEQLCIRFNKEVQNYMYQEINTSFQRLTDIEEKMRQVVTDVNVGNYGHTLGGHFDNLNVDF